MASDFDRALEEYAPEMKAQRLAREKAERERQRRAENPPDLDPTPLDQRELIDDSGIRIFRQPVGEQQLRRRLEAAHYQWEMAGQPEDGVAAEHLVEVLADVYRQADAGSDFEREVISYGDNLGLIDLLEAVAEDHNAEVRKAQYPQVAAEAFAGLTPEEVEKAGRLLEPALLKQVKAGTLDPDEFRAALALRVEMGREVVSTERKRDDLDAFDAELARHTPDEELQKTYREQLAEASDAEARISLERVEGRTERRLGIAQPKVDHGFEEALREHTLTDERLEREQMVRSMAEGEVVES